MSRLIDADELPISSIDMTDVGYYVSKYGQGIPAVYLEDIKYAPTIEPEPQWTPCSERLPEEYGEYYITWTTSLSEKPFIAICEGEVTSEYDFEHERFKFEWLLEDYIKAYPDVAVIAWMPLPEPFKEDRDD